MTPNPRANQRLNTRLRSQWFQNVYCGSMAAYAILIWIHIANLVIRNRRSIKFKLFRITSPEDQPAVLCDSSIAS